MAEDPEDPNEPGHEECMIFSPDGRTRVLFIEVPEAKQLKNRLHFDLRPVDLTRDQEVERLIAHGATVVADRRRPDGSAGSRWPTRRAMSSVCFGVTSRSPTRTPIWSCHSPLRATWGHFALGALGAK